jgi:hypothetical protein
MITGIGHGVGAALSSLFYNIAYAKNSTEKIEQTN